MARIAVAGAAGFIGSSLCEALVDRGDEVIGIDNLSTGRSENLAALAGQDRFRLLVHDVCAPIPVMEPLDVVMDLASPASPEDFDRIPLSILAVGSVGTWNLLDLARAGGARFLLASTSEIYGDPLVHPQDESYWGQVDPIGPRSCYDEAKRFSEALTVAYRAGPRRRCAHRPDLQHLRSSDSPRRRARRDEVHRPGPHRPAPHPLRGRRADP